MRLESLDLVDRQASVEELAGLADLLTGEGFVVTVAEPGESTWTSMREGAERALVDVLNVVFDEAERHAIRGRNRRGDELGCASPSLPRSRQRAASRGYLGRAPGCARGAIARSRARNWSDQGPQQWPMRAWLPVVRALGDGERQVGLIHEVDVIADEIIRVFGSTAQSEQALMAGGLIDGSRLPLRVENDSLERMLAGGWSVG